MDVEKRRPINRYKQKIKEKMMMIKKRKQKLTSKPKPAQIQIGNQSDLGLEKLNPSEKQKHRLIQRFNLFKGKEDKNKYVQDLLLFIESNNKDLLLKIVEQVDREQLNELIEEAIDQFVFGTANRKATSIRSLSGIFLDFVKNHMEEEDPMKVKAIFQKSATQQKKIMKEKEKSKVKASQSHISVNANAKNRNMFADLSDSNDDDDDDSDSENNKKQLKKDPNAMQGDDDDSGFEDVDDDEEMNE